MAQTADKPRLRVLTPEVFAAVLVDYNLQECDAVILEPPKQIYQKVDCVVFAKDEATLRHVEQDLINVGFTCLEEAGRGLVGRIFYADQLPSAKFGTNPSDISYKIIPAIGILEGVISINKDYVEGVGKVLRDKMQ